MGCGASHSVKVRKARLSMLKFSSSSLESLLPSSFTGDITKRYNLGATLGYGQYGTVRLAQSIYHPDEQFAVKTISFKRAGITLDSIRREIAILFHMDHPNIVRLYEVYEEKKYFHLITEYCSGGELFDRLVARGHYNEGEAAGLMQKVLRAVNYLHSKGVCHRDIKPENFMFESSELKLIDFGLAAKFEEQTQAEMNSQVGTAYYVAPEILTGPYTSKCDLWSVGIMLHFMVTGAAPYTAKSSADVIGQIATMKLDFNSPGLRDASEHVKDLLSKLLTRDPALRPTALEALSHPWFNSLHAQVVHLDPMVLFTLKRFRATSRLKSAALNVVAKRLTVRKVKDLREAFSAMDASSNGCIEVDELESALQSAGFNLTHEEVQEIMENVDFEGTGQITYSDFLAATLASKSIISEEVMLKTFSYFDSEGEGFITRKNLFDMMARSGRVISEEEAAGIIAEADVFREGKISFQAFKQILKQGG